MYSLRYSGAGDDAAGVLLHDCRYHLQRSVHCHWCHWCYWRIFSDVHYSFDHVHALCQGERLQEQVLELHSCLLLPDLWCGYGCCRYCCHSRSLIHTLFFYFCVWFLMNKHVLRFTYKTTATGLLFTAILILIHSNPVISFC